MTKFDRAAQLWSLLVFAARTQKILSYSMVQKLTGIPAVGVASFLAPIQNYCEDHGFPQLTSIVISEITGEPGEGFHKDETIDEPIHKAQSRVFVFDWFKIETPKPEDFQKAYEKHHPGEDRKQE